MPQRGSYIYGIIEETKEKYFTVDGVNGNRIGTINYKDLAAVVSHKPMVSYDRFDEQSNVSDLRAHQLVLENILKDYSVIPMGFGIIAKSDNDVKELLKTAYADFKDTFREIDNKVELNVQVICYEAAILNEVVTDNKAVYQLKRELISADADDADRIKIEVGKAVISALNEIKDEYVKNILETLKEVAISSCPGKLADAQMIVNESFLVARDRETEFDQRVNQLAEKYKDRVKFKYIGPMPPYSFVNLVATVVNAGTVNKARNLLGLGEQVTGAEIKNAYRELAKKYHPDNNRNSPAQVEKFREVSEASQMLMRYVKSLKPAENGQYAFIRGNQIKDAIIVTRRR